MRPHNRKRDEKYLEWIRSLACVACESLPTDVRWGLSAQPVRVEATHFRLRGQRCSDRETIPLCAGHYQALGKRFRARHGLDKAELIRDLNERYEQEALVSA